MTVPVALQKGSPSHAGVLTEMQGAPEVLSGISRVCVPPSILFLFSSPSALLFLFLSSLASLVYNSSRLRSPAFPHLWQPSLLHPSSLYWLVVCVNLTQARAIREEGALVIEMLS